jgi:hypothetical protein
MTASFIFSVSALYVACGHEIGIHAVKTAYDTREENFTVLIAAFSMQREARTEALPLTQSVKDKLYFIPQI